MNTVTLVYKNNHKSSPTNNVVHLNVLLTKGTLRTNIKLKSSTFTVVTQSKKIMFLIIFKPSCFYHQEQILALIKVLPCPVQKQEALAVNHIEAQGLHTVII